MKNLIKKRLKKILIILIIIISILFFGYKKKKAFSKKNKYSTYQVKKQNLKETLTLSGEIDAEEKVNLRFQTSGRLSWVGVKEGDYVKKYQSIASLDKRELKNRLQKYLNTYVKDRLDFEQTKDDYWQQQYDLSPSIRKEAERILKKNQYTLNSSVLDVEFKDLALKYANLWSPIDGIVTQIESPHAGVNIIPSQAEFKIVNPKSIYFSVLADQTDVVKVKNNLQGTIILDSYLNKTIKGTVKFISFTPKTEESGTVYEIKVFFKNNNNDLKYKIGMTGDFEFVVREKKNSIAIPVKYLHSENNINYVLKLKNKKKIKTLISLGNQFDDLIEIKKGLQNNDVIVSN